MLDYAQYIKIFIGLLAILNPLGVIPLFISMTADESTKQRSKTIDMEAIGVTDHSVGDAVFGRTPAEPFWHHHRFVSGGGRHSGVVDGDCDAACQNQPGEADGQRGGRVDREGVGGDCATGDAAAGGTRAISPVILTAHKGHGTVHYLMIALIIVLQARTVGAFSSSTQGIDQEVGTNVAAAFATQPDARFKQGFQDGIYLSLTTKGVSFGPFVESGRQQ